MTIDERLEALTQSLELLASLHQDNEQRAKTNEDVFNQRFERIESALEKLVTIAESHERRLDKGGL